MFGAQILRPVLCVPLCPKSEFSPSRTETIAAIGEKKADLTLTKQVNNTIVVLILWIFSHVERVSLDP